MICTSPSRVFFLVLIAVFSCGVLFSAETPTPSSKEKGEAKKISDWILARYKEAKVGDWSQNVEFSSFDTGKYCHRCDHMVTQKTDNLIVHKITISLPGPGGEPYFSETRLDQASSPLIEKGDVEGDEVLYVNGVKFQCHFFTKSFGKKNKNGQILSSYSTMWLCKDIPIDGVLKTEDGETLYSPTGVPVSTRITHSSIVVDFGRGQ